MKKLILSLILTSSIATISFKAKENQSTISKFSGNWSSEGNVTATGILTFELNQTKAKIEGVSQYDLNDVSQKSGLMSVNGYVKNGIAFIRFRNQKGEVLADGTLKVKGNVLIFKQTTKSFWLPKIGYAYKAK